jgi:hypothetical protein
MHHVHTVEETTACRMSKLLKRGGALDRERDDRILVRSRRLPKELIHVELLLSILKTSKLFDTGDTSAGYEKVKYQRSLSTFKISNKAHETDPRSSRACAQTVIERGRELSTFREKDRVHSLVVRPRSTCSHRLCSRTT